MLQTQRAKKSKKAAGQYGKRAVAAEPAPADPWDDGTSKAYVYGLSSPSSGSSSSSANSGSAWGDTTPVSTVASRSTATSTYAQKPTTYGSKKPATGTTKQKSSALSKTRKQQSSQPAHEKKDEWMFGELATAGKENKQATKAKTAKPKSKKPAKPAQDFSDFFEEKTESSRPVRTCTAGPRGSSDKQDTAPRQSTTMVPETPGPRLLRGYGLRGCQSNDGEDPVIVVPESPDFCLSTDQFQATSTPLCPPGACIPQTAVPFPSIALQSGPTLLPLVTERGSGGDGTSMLRTCGVASTQSDSEAHQYTEMSAERTPMSGTDSEGGAGQRGDSTPPVERRQTRQMAASRNQARRSCHRKSLALRQGRHIVGSTIDLDMTASPTNVSCLQPDPRASKRSPALPIVIPDESTADLHHCMSDVSLFAPLDPSTHQPSTTAGYFSSDDDTNQDAASVSQSPGGSPKGGTLPTVPGKVKRIRTPDPRVVKRHLANNLIGDVTLAEWVFSPADVTMSPRQRVLSICDQSQPLPFSAVFTKSVMRQCRKVGEGVYGEVFVANNDQSQPVAFKVIPIEGKQTVNGEPQKTFEEMIPEMLISTALSQLGDTANPASPNFTTNFIRLHRVACCQGTFPASLLKLWDTWHHSHSSENDRPDFYPTDQLFIVFEFANGGSDLEHSTLTNYKQALSTFQQVAIALATAEQAVEFEHRDLHWGNILLRKCSNSDQVKCRMNGTEFALESCGVHVSLIDFTLSRLKHEGTTVFCDMSVDPTLFTGQGDFQFEVYRLMRDQLSNDWKQAMPSTNILWLRYLLDKLLHEVAYQQRSAHRNVRSQLTRLLNRLKSQTYTSAWQLVKNDDVFTSMAIANN